MQENTVVNEQIISDFEDSDKYQVLVTGIAWGKDSPKTKYLTKENKIHNYPEQFTLEISENILNEANKPKNSFNDIIESFVYNTLSRKFGKDIVHCQIWLPLEK